MSKQFLPWSSVLVLLGLGSSLNPAIAALPQQAESARSPNTLEISQLNLPAPDGSSPGSTAGGGKRGGCLNREAKALFVPLMPGNKAGTLSSAPGLWWYIPQNSAFSAELSIFKQTGDGDALVHYQVINNVQGRSGLLQVNLPENTLMTDNSYWWDLTLTCDAVNAMDRSADVYLWGSIERMDPSKIAIRNDPEVLQSLAATLLGQNSYLTLPTIEARELGQALQTDPNDATVAMVESRLREHFIGLQNDYAKLGQSIRKLQQNPSVNSGELESLKAQRGGMVLELVQLSAYFGTWGDAVNFLASYRADHPDEWDSLVKAIFPGDDLNTDRDEGEIIRVLETAQNFPMN